MNRIWLVVAGLGVAAVGQFVIPDLPRGAVDVAVFGAEFPVVPWLLVTIIVVGIGEAFAFPAQQAIFVSIGRRVGMGSMMGLNQMGGGLGFLGGSLIGAASVASFGVESVFRAAGVITLIGALLFAVMMTRALAREAAANQAPAPTRLDEARPAPELAVDAVLEGSDETERMSRTSEATLEAPGRPGVLASFDEPEFRTVWFGAVLFGLGMWMERLAIGWFVLDETGSVFLAAPLVRDPNSAEPRARANRRRSLGSPPARAGPDGDRPDPDGRGRGHVAGRVPRRRDDPGAARPGLRDRVDDRVPEHRAATAAG